MERKRLHKAEPAADVKSEAHQLWQWELKSPVTMVDDGAGSLMRAVRRVSTKYCRSAACWLWGLFKQANDSGWDEPMGVASTAIASKFCW